MQEMGARCKGERGLLGRAEEVARGKQKGRRPPTLFTGRGLGFAGMADVEGTTR